MSEIKALLFGAITEMDESDARRLWKEAEGIFYSSMDGLEKLVYDIDPTAEFNRTMHAEEIRRTQSSDVNNSIEHSLGDEEE